ncbi:MAG: hypothetical protein Q8P92_04785 [Candidatus Daviesbacteria bacterium]|nr:hypothetical protein [Candidatus Daviesbacteria bacterium]
MTPDRFVPIKLAEYKHSDLQEAKQLLVSINPGTDIEERIRIALTMIDQMPNKADTPEFEELAKGIIQMRLLAYKFWYINCVEEGKVLRGNISVWQRTPDPDFNKLSFEATFGGRS